MKLLEWLGTLLPQLPNPNHTAAVVNIKHQSIKSWPTLALYTGDDLHSITVSSQCAPAGWLSR